MDILEQLEELALGSRMRRLADRLTQDVSLYYKEQNIDFEPRWFPVYYLLSKYPEASIVDIAKAIGITHPAVNQIATDMLKHGIVYAFNDPNDKRKRMLALSEKGRALLPQVEPIWTIIRQSAKELTEATGYNVIAMLDMLEHTLDQQSFYTRLQEKTDNTITALIEQSR